MNIIRKIHDMCFVKYFLLRNIKHIWTYIKRSTVSLVYKIITAYFNNKTFTSNFLYLYIYASPFAMWAIVYLEDRVVFILICIVGVMFFQCFYIYTYTGVQHDFHVKRCSCCITVTWRMPLVEQDQLAPICGVRFVQFVV